MSLRERKMATGSISTMANAIYHFYDMNDVVLNKKKINMFKGEFSKIVVDRPYTHEEIAKALNVAKDSRYQSDIHGNQHYRVTLFLFIY